MIKEVKEELALRRKLVILQYAGTAKCNINNKEFQEIIDSHEATAKIIAGPYQK
jgi:hypothetical protein